MAETVSFCWPRYKVSWTTAPDGDPWTSLVSPWAEVTALPLKSTMTSPVRMPAVSAGDPLTTDTTSAPDAGTRP